MSQLNQPGSGETPPAYFSEKTIDRNQDVSPVAASPIAKYDNILEVITAVLDGELKSDGAPTDYEVKRVRNFLAYCLAIDYNVDIGAKLSAADRTHFLRLSTQMCDLELAQRVAPTTAEERHILGPYFWTYIHSPAKALGLPSDLVVLYIHSFKRFTSGSAQYKGSIRGILHDGGLGKLAFKLYVDREVVIPAVVTATEEGKHRKALLTHLNDFQAIYFASISGFKASTLMRDGRWCHAHFEDYVLNSTGEQYRAERMHGTAGQPLARLESRKPVWERVDKVLDRFKKRAGVRRAFSWEKTREACTKGPQDKNMVDPVGLSADDKLVPKSIFNTDLWQQEKFHGSHI